MSTLLEIADRAAASIGPTRKIDIAIALSQPERFFNAGPKYEGGRDRIGEIVGGDRCVPGNGSADWLVPRYTASLDDALKLVPEDAGYNLDRYWIREGVRWGVEIATGGVPEQPRQVFDCWDAHSAALATTAAALRAVAAAGGSF